MRALYLPLLRQARLLKLSETLNKVTMQMETQMMMQNTRMIAVISSPTTTMRGMKLSQMMKIVIVFQKTEMTMTTNNFCLENLQWCLSRLRDHHLLLLSQRFQE